MQFSSQRHKVWGIGMTQHRAIRTTLLQDYAIQQRPVTERQA